MRTTRHVWIAVALLAACASETPKEEGPAGPAGPAGPTELWTPGTVYPAPRAEGVRGFLDLRGLIHAHSVYSHDACDGVPEVDGVRDPVCFEDFRRGLCQAQHDFVFLTDHRDAFDHTEFPDALLYRPEKGDALVERGGRNVASFAACPDGSRALILAGCESGMMPVGLEAHVEGRGAVYGEQTAEAAAAERANGAVVLLAHPEGFSVEELKRLPVDGFEMYNLHANTFANIDRALALLAANDAGEPGLPEPDTSLLAFVSEEQSYLDRWGSVLATGRKLVTTVGTDCHRNTFPALMEDGERIDSYRRMMIWFSNHLLVRPDEAGTWDDRQLKEALAAGRLYGAFEVMGYPVGFDFHAEAAGALLEMGDEVPLSDGPVLSVRPGQVRGLDPTVAEPELTVRILRAVEGGFVEEATGAGELTFTPAQPGAYRAEVRMVPRHLRAALRDSAPEVLGESLPWIYSNPIYVR